MVSVVGAGVRIGHNVILCSVRPASRRCLVLAAQAVGDVWVTCMTRLYSEFRVLAQVPRVHTALVAV